MQVGHTTSMAAEVWLNLRKHSHSLVTSCLGSTLSPSETSPGSIQYASLQHVREYIYLSSIQAQPMVVLPALATANQWQLQVCDVMMVMVMLMQVQHMISTAAAILPQTQGQAQLTDSQQATAAPKPTAAPAQWNAPVNTKKVSQRQAWHCPLNYIMSSYVLGIVCTPCLSTLSILVAMDLHCSSECDRFSEGCLRHYSAQRHACLPFWICYITLSW